MIAAANSINKPLSIGKPGGGVASVWGVGGGGFCCPKTPAISINRTAVQAIFFLLIVVISA